MTTASVSVSVGMSTIGTSTDNSSGTTLTISAGGTAIIIVPSEAGGGSSAVGATITNGSTPISAVGSLFALLVPGNLSGSVSVWKHVNMASPISAMVRMASMMSKDSRSGVNDMAWTAESVAVVAWPDTLSR